MIEAKTTLPKRRSTRIPGYDYSQPGFYFVTACSFERRCIFGWVECDRVRLSPVGKIVEDSLIHVPRHLPTVHLDCHVVMPNHVHAIFEMLEGDRNTALGTVIGSFKSSSTRDLNKMLSIRAIPIWQRGFFEHVIRTDSALFQFRQYVLDNPIQWHVDRLNPEFETA